MERSSKSYHLAIRRIVSNYGPPDECEQRQNDDSRHEIARDFVG